jgi:hypothetical protein
MTPACPPQVDARVFDATVVVVERARYQCEVTPEGAAPGCIEAHGTTPCREGLVVTLADATRRARQEEPPFVLAVCDLPAGTHTATICTHDGPRSLRGRARARTASRRTERPLPAVNGTRAARRERRCEARQVRR